MQSGYKSYDDIPVWMVDYLLTVSGARRIEQLSIEDINGFISGIDDYFNNRDQAKEADRALGHFGDAYYPRVNSSY